MIITRMIKIVTKGKEKLLTLRKILIETLLSDFQTVVKLI